MASLLAARKPPVQFGRTSVHDAKRSLFRLRRDPAVPCSKDQCVRGGERMISLSSNFR
jgi:hypothetical protein